MAYLSDAHVAALVRCQGGYAPPAEGLGIFPAILGAVTAIAPVVGSALDKFGSKKNKGADQNAALLMQLQQQQAAQAAAQARQQRNLVIGLGVGALVLTTVVLATKRKREPESKTT